jgi:glyoxylase-like metal-dependent hydrolase (beta-lactamase superfamily II)
MAAAEEIFPFIYAVPLGYVNAFMLADPDGPTLIDAGLRGNHKRIRRAIRDIGRKPEELRHVLITHHHADHVGSLAPLLEGSGAQAWVHALDAPIVAGEQKRPHPNPSSIAGRILGPVLSRIPPNNPPPAKATNLVKDGDIVPVGGGVRVIETPGHTAGHVSYFVEGHGGVLFAGDAAAHMFGRIGKPALIFIEDMTLAKLSMRKLAELEFETACFGHGTVLKGRANIEFRRYVERMAR